MTTITMVCEKNKRAEWKTCGKYRLDMTASIGCGQTIVVGRIYSRQFCSREYGMNTCNGFADAVRQLREWYPEVNFVADEITLADLDS